MEYKNFSELYLKGCQIRHENPICLFAFKDLDLIKIVEYQECFLKAGILMNYNNFIYKDKLPPDHNNFIIVYHKIEKIIELINSMQDNNIISLNKWKIKQIEKVVTLGWEKYCKEYIDSCISSF